MKDPNVRESPNHYEFIKNSTLYNEFLAERNEILKHKWIESEKLGYDIGYECALLDWVRNYRDNWRANHRRLQRLHTQ